MTADNREAARKAEVLILSVKPQYYAEAIAEIRDCVSDDQLIITIAPGKTLAWLEEQFGKPVRIVRTMPNTPALVGEGMTAACVNPYVTEEEKAYALKILESFGKVEIVPEHMIDAVVAVSGSSPAYVFMFIEAMADAAVAEGMPRGAGVSVRGPGGVRQREDGHGDRETSRRIKRYGLLSGGNDDRGGPCAGGGDSAARSLRR